MPCLGALMGPCPRSLTQRWLRPSSGDPLMLGDAHFTMGGLNALPRLTLWLTPQGWGPQTPDRLQSHLRQRHRDSKWGEGSPAALGGVGQPWALHPPSTPPFAAGSLPRSPAQLITPGRGGLAAKEEEGRNNLPLPPRGPALTLPRPPPPAPPAGTCVLGLSVPSRQTPTQTWLGGLFLHW